MRIVALFLFFLSLVVCRELLIWDTKIDMSHIRISLPEKDELVFFALGDSGSGSKNQKLVAELMEKRCQQLEHLDGLLFLGDNIYPSGAKSVDDEAFETLIDGPYNSPCLKKARLYPVLGNHDYDGNPQAQVDYSKKNPRWFMPNRFYSLRYGSLLELVAFDSNQSDFCLKSSRCSLDFLYRRLVSSETKWTFVLSHHPLASASSKKSSHTGLSPWAWLIRQFACKKADAWLSGHTHHLEHRRLPGCETNFFISGGGGAYLHRPHLDQKESLFVKRDFGFLELTVRKESFTSRFFTKEGLEFERVQKKL